MRNEMGGRRRIFVGVGRLWENNSECSAQWGLGCGQWDKSSRIARSQ